MSSFPFRASIPGGLSSGAQDPNPKTGLGGFQPRATPPHLPAEGNVPQAEVFSSTWRHLVTALLGTVHARDKDSSS